MSESVSDPVSAVKVGAGADSNAGYGAGSAGAGAGTETATTGVAISVIEGTGARALTGPTTWVEKSRVAILSGEMARPKEWS